MVLKINFHKLTEHIAPPYDESVLSWTYLSEILEILHFSFWHFLFSAKFVFQFHCLLLVAPGSAIWRTTFGLRRFHLFSWILTFIQKGILLLSRHFLVHHLWFPILQTYVWLHCLWVSWNAELGQLKNNVCYITLELLIPHSVSTFLLTIAHYTAYWLYRTAIGLYMMHTLAVRDLFNLFVRQPAHWKMCKSWVLGEWRLCRV